MNREVRIQRRKYRLDFNSPVILTFTLVSLIFLIIDVATNGMMTGLFAVRFTSWLDPMMYLRLFTHIFCHAGMEHYAGNFMMILVVGPIMEEKYGSTTMMLMIAATSFVTGFINILLFKGVALIGASGVVFMLIILSSFTNLKEGKIPLTVILVAILYIGNEVISGIFIQDNISRISHIAGGFIGGFFGFHLNKEKLQNRGF